MPGGRLNSHAVVSLVLAGILGGVPGAVAAADEVPRPEHPQPQMVRSEWLNLNGVWEFGETDDASASFLGAAQYPDKITAPFCRESELSGLKRVGFVKNVWYRRSFTVPAGWKSHRVLLHVGACDWRTNVWVNGQPVGEHVGGSAPFAFDITQSLQPNGNTVIIHAFDDIRSGLQACGKQSQEEKSHGCVYTRTTGIWQTVWLEGVGTSFIKQVLVVPDPANSRILVTAEVDGPSEGLALEATASAEGKEAGKGQAAAQWRHTELTLDLSPKRLWSPSDPFLYELKLTLTRGGDRVDSVDSYFGLRSVTIEGAAMLINGEAVFQRLVLDQGFYPEGIWTAPTDAALKQDIEMSQAVGFNGARLHQKVFDPRYLYWADKLGYLVWGEFPNWGLNYENPAVNLPVVNEWCEIVARDRNHPAIIGWCPFNETPPPAGPLQNAIVTATRKMDPTRPMLDSSGYYHGLPDPDLLDAHDYDENPATFRARWESFFGDLALPERYSGARREVPFFVSEYGGIGWQVGKEAWGYGQGPKTLDEFYARYKGLTDALLDNRYMCGFCYTQITDIEQEQNGIYTYQRVAKFDAARLHAINLRKAQYETNPPKQVSSSGDAWRVLVGAVPDGPLAREWRYVTEDPGQAWKEGEFNDATWKLGRGGFGKKEGWERRTGTPWDGKDIWLRQTFDYDNAAVGRAMLVIHYDNATEVYVNGQAIWAGQKWNDRYQGFDITERFRSALRPGRNTVAVHCHQDDGGQFIDLAILTAQKQN